jgi:plastocyanin
MKKKFTLVKKVPGEINFLLLLFITMTPVIINAQTKHIVEASNNVFTPASLEIQAGDTVEWRNVEGTHNVNGTQTTYSSNPASFGNDLGTGWTYSYVFTVTGNYNYQCDLHVSQGMVGQITVSVSTSVPDNYLNTLKLYPNPAKDKVWIEGHDINSGGVFLSLFDISGKKYNPEYKLQDYRIEFNTSGLIQGIYIVEIKNNSGRKMLKLIKE